MNNDLKLFQGTCVYLNRFYTLASNPISSYLVSSQYRLSQTFTLNSTSKHLSQTQQAIEPLPTRFEGWARLRFPRPQEILNEPAQLFHVTKCIKVSQIITNYLELTQTIANYLKTLTPDSISNYLKLSHIISNYLKLSQNTHPRLYLKLSQIITNYLKLSQIISNYLKVSQIISNYLKLSQIISNMHVT